MSSGGKLLVEKSFTVILKTRGLWNAFYQSSKVYIHVAHQTDAGHRAVITLEDWPCFYIVALDFISCSPSLVVITARWPPTWWAICRMIIKSNINQIFEILNPLLILVIASMESGRSIKKRLKNRITHKSYIYVSEETVILHKLNYYKMLLDYLLKISDRKMISSLTTDVIVGWNHTILKIILYTPQEINGIQEKEWSFPEMKKFHISSTYFKSWNSWKAWNGIRGNCELFKCNLRQASK